MEADILDLREWRQQRGISLAAIADITKLSKRQLEAIETARFDRLPGGIYTTSYIRQYARAIGFDEAIIMSYYEASRAPVPVERPKHVPLTPQLFRQPC